MFRCRNHLLAHQAIKHLVSPLIGELVAVCVFRHQRDPQPVSIVNLYQNLIVHRVEMRKVIFHFQAQYVLQLFQLLQELATVDLTRLNAA